MPSRARYKRLLASVKDTMERLLLLAKVERGIQQANAGELIPHEKVEERMAKWLK